MNGKFNLSFSGFQLKIIALFTMLIDHIGVLYPDMSFMRNIGRMSFPLFAFMLSEGFCHTRNRSKYALRLLVCAFLSEIPFDIFIFSEPFNFSHQNIFFTLFLSFVMLWLCEKVRPKTGFAGDAVIILLFSLSSEIMHFDYGAFGVILIYSFHSYRLCNFSAGCVSNKNFQSFCRLLNILFPALVIIVFHQGVPYSLCVLPLILLYKGSKGRSIKWLFYIFYPLHLLLLSFVITFLS